MITRQKEFFSFLAQKTTELKNACDNFLEYLNSETRDNDTGIDFNTIWHNLFSAHQALQNINYTGKIKFGDSLTKRAKAELVVLEFSKASFILGLFRHFQQTGYCVAETVITIRPENQKDYVRVFGDAGIQFLALLNYHKVFQDLKFTCGDENLECFLTSLTKEKSFSDHYREMRMRLIDINQLALKDCRARLSRLLEPVENGHINAAFRSIIEFTQGTRDYVSAFWDVKKFLWMNSFHSSIYSSLFEGDFRVALGGHHLKLIQHNLLDLTNFYRYANDAIDRKISQNPESLKSRKFMALMLLEALNVVHYVCENQTGHRVQNIPNFISDAGLAPLMAEHICTTACEYFQSDKEKVKEIFQSDNEYRLLMNNKMSFSPRSENDVTGYYDFIGKQALCQLYVCLFEQIRIEFSSSDSGPLEKQIYIEKATDEFWDILTVNDQVQSYKDKLISRGVVEPNFDGGVPTKLLDQDVAFNPPVHEHNLDDVEADSHTRFHDTLFANSVSFDGSPENGFRRDSDPIVSKEEALKKAIGPVPQSMFQTAQLVRENISIIFNELHRYWNLRNGDIYRRPLAESLKVPVETIKKARRQFSQQIEFLQKAQQYDSANPGAVVAYMEVAVRDFFTEFFVGFEDACARNEYMHPSVVKNLFDRMNYFLTVHGLMISYGWSKDLIAGQPVYYSCMTDVHKWKIPEITTQATDSEKEAKVIEERLEHYLRYLESFIEHKAIKDFSIELHDKGIIFLTEDLPDFHAAIAKLDKKSASANKLIAKITDEIHALISYNSHELVHELMYLNITKPADYHEKRSLLETQLQNLARQIKAIEALFSGEQNSKTQVIDIPKK